MVDRDTRLKLLEALRQKNFRSLKEIVVATGFDSEKVKEGLQELIKDKLVYFNEL